MSVPPATFLSLEADAWSAVIAGVALIVAVATAVWTIRRERVADRTARLNALQGEKEAVAYVAQQIRSKVWQKELRSRRFRQEIVAALCLAFVMKGQDRVKALVLAALRVLIDDHHKRDVETVLLRLYADMLRYQEEFKPEKFDKRLETLRRLASCLNIVLPVDAASAKS